MTQTYIWQLATDKVPPAECGCGTERPDRPGDRWRYCERHSAILTEARLVWDHGKPEMFDIIWSLSDGYGEPGLIPPQGYDWSGIRDSSLEAIEAMHKAMHA